VVVDVFKLVPDRRGTGISVVVESHSRGLCVVFFEFEVFLDSINDSTSTGMDTEVINTTLEVGLVRLDLWQLGSSFRRKRLADSFQNKSSNDAPYDEGLF
jgi:hypothetical protein